MTFQKIRTTALSVTASRGFRITMYTILVVVVVLGIFHAGMVVGYHKARFSFASGDNYFRAFGDDAHGISKGGKDRKMYEAMKGMRDGRFMNTHGTVGKIIKIEGETILVLGKDGMEQTVIISSSTILRYMRDTVAQNSLHIDTNIAVIGEANEQGFIEAKLIRILGEGFLFQRDMIMENSMQVKER